MDQIIIPAAPTNSAATKAAQGLTNHDALMVFQDYLEEPWTCADGCICVGISCPFATAIAFGSGFLTALLGGCMEVALQVIGPPGPPLCTTYTWHEYLANYTSWVNITNSTEWLGNSTNSIGWLYNITNVTEWLLNPDHPIVVVDNATFCHDGTPTWSTASITDKPGCIAGIAIIGSPIVVMPIVAFFTFSTLCCWNECCIKPKNKNISAKIRHFANENKDLPASRETILALASYSLDDDTDQKFVQNLSAEQLAYLARYAKGSSPKTIR